MARVGMGRGAPVTPPRTAGSGFALLAPLLADDPPGQHSRHLGTASARRLQALFEQVHDAETRDTTLANTGLAYLLALAWRTFLDTTDLVDAIDVHPAVRTVARLLQTNPGTADLTTLARRVGLSPSHLSRLFTAHTGIPLTTYRNHQRLRHFLRHYGDGTHTTMLTAALAAGFGSYAQFYRVFHRETGHSPAALPV